MRWLFRGRTRTGTVTTALAGLSWAATLCILMPVAKRGHQGKEKICLRVNSLFSLSFKKAPRAASFFAPPELAYASCKKDTLG